MAKAPVNASPRQAQWFASVRAGLEAETGRSLEEWVALVQRDCPETAHKKRLAWLKDVHGLGVNRGGVVLEAAFPTVGWDDPDALAAALWKSEPERKILAALDAAVSEWPGLVRTQRKGYTAYSKEFQFAALAPRKPAGVRLGLALPPNPKIGTLPRRKSESWSERLTATLELNVLTDVTAEVVGLLRAAYERS